MPDPPNPPVAYHADDAICFSDVLDQELEEIKQLRKKRPGDYVSPEVPGHSSEKIFKRAHEMNLTGLAFSGGGIRSATFNLGVLQGLAEYGRLGMFDYLSTVSGGGYIGSWLEAWIFREGSQERDSYKKTHKTSGCAEDKVTSGIRLVEAALDPDRARREARTKQIDREMDEKLRAVLPPEALPRPGEPRTEPKPIRFLREYSNYLTPRLGILGADTWTMVAIYLRNLLLNQAILTLFLFSLLLLPYIAVWVTQWCSTRECFETYCVAPILVFLLNTAALCMGAANLKDLGACQHQNKQQGWWTTRSQGTVVTLIGIPHFLSAWIVTAWIWNHPEFWSGEGYWWRWPLGGFVGLSVPWIISCFFAPGPQKDSRNEEEGEADWGLRNPRLAWGLVSLITGAVGGLLFYAVATQVFSWLQNGVLGQPWHEMALGVPLVLMGMLLCAGLQMGLMGRTFVDPYREWWSRLAGWLFILSIVWAVGFGVAIYAPLGLMWLRNWAAGVGFTWLASTATGVIGGNSSKTGGKEAPGMIDKLLSVTPYIFIGGLASMIALSLELIMARVNWSASLSAAWCNFLSASPAVAKVANWVLTLNGSLTTTMVTANGTAVQAASSHAAPAYIAAHWQLLGSALNCKLLIWCGAAFLICLFLSWRVDLNEFSLNLFYRNRLVRCYLGATRPNRTPNSFAGFDPCDDLYLTALQHKHCYSGPFPIFNTTLNLVGGHDLAWQERKAESFPMTPLHCGYDTWLERMDFSPESSKAEGKHGMRTYAFRPTKRFLYSNGGPFVGTTVSISGAALSPNMGYHSVPSLAMLMTFFNVRLGFWAGNTRNDKTWQNPGPSVGLWRLLAELFGLTDDGSKYVYLSDGGHFENLGVYELVKRRCRYIIACDAGADPNYALDDLGNAIRKCREDIGVEIELNTKPVVLTAASTKCSDNTADKGGPKTSAVGAKKWTQCHCVTGKIHYEMIDPGAEPGTFVYLKASVTGEEPGDILNYQTLHKDFPHESTANQWFTESQFESYRRLGQHVVEAMFEPLGETKVSDRESGLDADQSKATEELFEKLAKHWTPPVLKPGEPSIDDAEEFWKKFPTKSIKTIIENLMQFWKSRKEDRE